MQASRAVNGLLYLPRFVTRPQHDALVAGCAALRHQVLTAAGGGSTTQAFIPQPQHVQSAKHNLASKESFVPLRLAGGPGTPPLQCEFFARYGEDGHELTYFRGNHNLPRFVFEDVVTKVERLAPIQQLAVPSDLTWKLTHNTYRAKRAAGSGDQLTTAGFPFHVDIPANGEVTMILSLVQGATMELAHEDDEDARDVVTVEMEAGGLLVLSGEARYHWRHRVLPAEQRDCAEDEVRRISLVLGVSAKRRAKPAGVSS